jgi:hypothetical protein
MTGCQYSFNFDWILEERLILLSLHETYLERREEKLEEEQAHGLHSFDRRDLLAELHELVAGVESERAAEAVTLSQSVMEISNALVDLGVFPIWDIPKHQKSARDVLTMAGLVLERLREEHDSGASSWV